MGNEYIKKKVGDAVYFDFSTCNQPVYPMDIGVDAIYRIIADKSYQITHKEFCSPKYFLCLTTAGKGEIVADNARVVVHEKTFVLLRPQSSLSYHCSGEEWQFWWAEFYCANINLELSRTHMADSMARLNYLMEQGLFLAKKGEWKAASGLVASILGTLCHSAGSDKDNSGIPTTAEEYIQETLDTVTVAKFCEHLQISDRTLRNLFHKSFQMSPKQFILKTRMEQAQQLLEDTTLSIGEVAARLGFANPFHFSGSFKAYYGIPPSEYRKKALFSSKV